MYYLLSQFSVFFLYGTLIIGPFIAFGILSRPKNDTLTGIQGWLAWLALGQVFGLGNLAWLAHTELARYRALRDLMANEPAVAASFEFVMSTCVYLVVQIVVTYALFAKKRYFRKLFLLDWILLLVLTCVDTAYAAYVSDTNVFDALTAQDVGIILSVVALSTIPVAYVLRSRRVANTMVH